MIPLKVEFPGLGLQSLVVPGKFTGQEALEYIQAKQGGNVSSSRMGLRADPMSFLYASEDFKAEPNYPFLSPELPIEHYGNMLRDATLHWDELQALIKVFDRKWAATKKKNRISNFFFSLQVRFFPTSFPIKSKTYVLPYEWPVAQIQEHIINALASSGADATGFRLRVPNEEDHTPAMSRVVKDLIFSCSDFPYLDAEKPLRKYKELITTAPFILMAESSAPKERAATVFAAPPPLVAPPMPPVVEEVLVVTPPEETFSASPPPSIKTFSPPPPPSFSTPPPPMLSATEDRAPLRAPPPLAPPPSLSEPSEPPSVLLAPPSLVTAAASLSVQVAFPMDSHLPMQSFRIPADATIQEAMDQIRRETGGVLSEHSSLCVDPMARHVGTFANAPSFPYFDNSVSLTFYREAVTRNVLYWRNTKESGSASTAKGGAPGQDSSASVDAHPNEYLLKGNQRDSFFFF